MKPMTKEAHGFVQGVIGYLRQGSKAKNVLPKMQLFLNQVTKQARQSNLAKVESAVPLNAQEKERLTDIINHLVGHQVTLDITVKKELGGGFYVQIADWIIDASLMGELKVLSQNLLS